MSEVATSPDERLLVLMPTAKDAARTVAFFSNTGISCTICSDIVSLCREIQAGAGAALVTAEAIHQDRPGALIQTLQDEPSWSNFPLIVLTHQPEETQRALAHSPLLMTLVERPVRVATLRSVVQAALRHRRHQYRNRDMLANLANQAEELRHNEERLRQLAQNLSQAKWQLEQANQELEARVQQRTEKLRESVAELEAFSYSISHDLRSPLRAMHGYADALLQEKGGQLDEEARLYVGRIKRAAARMDLLTRDVLAYSRVAQGDVQLREIPLEALIREVLETYPDISEHANITLDLPMPTVWAHEAFLAQCVTNLLGNAKKFVSDGIVPEVRVRAEEEEGGHIRLWFEDNGIGIDPEHHQQIFQIFGRVYSETRFEGTGIGLAIVKKAAQRMGGSVGVVSDLGKGSRFWISLKRANETRRSHPPR